MRQALSSLISPAGGTVGAGGLLVSPHAAPNMSVNVLGGTPAQGGIWIPGTSVPETQGLYYCYAPSTTNLVVGPSDATNPRIDRVVAVVKDEAVAGSGNEWALEVLAGTPTAGAKQNDKKGEKAAPVSSITLAHLLVPAKATTITAEDIENVATAVGLGAPLLASWDKAYNLKAFTKGAAEAGVEPSATRPSFVVLTNSGAPGILSLPGGAEVALVSALSFPLLPTQKWKANVAVTAVTLLQ